VHAWIHVSGNPERGRGKLRSISNYGRTRRGTGGQPDRQLRDLLLQIIESLLSKLTTRISCHRQRSNELAPMLSRREKLTDVFLAIRKVHERAGSRVEALAVREPRTRAIVLPLLDQDSGFLKELLSALRIARLAMGSG
jgi:hypothetical protein